MPFDDLAFEHLGQRLVLVAAGALLAIGVEEAMAIEMVALRATVEIGLGAAAGKQRESQGQRQASRKPTPIDARACSVSPETTG